MAACRITSRSNAAVLSTSRAIQGPGCRTRGSSSAGDSTAGSGIMTSARGSTCGRCCRRRAICRSRFMCPTADSWRRSRVRPYVASAFSAGILSLRLAPRRSRRSLTTEEMTTRRRRSTQRSRRSQRADRSLCVLSDLCVRIVSSSSRTWTFRTSVTPWQRRLGSR